MSSVSQAQKLINEHRPDDVPQKERMSLIRQQNSLTVTVMKDAWADQGISLDSPGTVDQYYYEDEGVLVIDFSEE